jgi:hypothetical protein
MSHDLISIPFESAESLSLSGTTEKTCTSISAEDSVVKSHDFRLTYPNQQMYLDSGIICAEKASESNTNNMHSAGSCVTWCTNCKTHVRHVNRAFSSEPDYFTCHNITGPCDNANCIPCVSREFWSYAPLEVKSSFRTAVHLRSLSCNNNCEVNLTNIDHLPQIDSPLNLCKFSGNLSDILESQDPTDTDIHAENTNNFIIKKRRNSGSSSGSSSQLSISLLSTSEMIQTKIRNRHNSDSDSDSLKIDLPVETSNPKSVLSEEESERKIVRFGYCDSECSDSPVKASDLRTCYFVTISHDKTCIPIIELLNERNGRNMLMGTDPCHNFLEIRDAKRTTFRKIK